MRAVLACAMALLGLSLWPAHAGAQDFKVTLLGTGSPFPDPNRFGAATLVQAGPEKLLFDAGRGATIRLNQIGVPIGSINAVFITHFHSDHTGGLPDLWLTGWIQRYYGNRKAPFRIIGPKGTTSLMQNLERAYWDDIRIRYDDEKYPMDAIAISPSEFASDGVVYEKNGVKVTAFEVDHGVFIKPAYGYRVDYGGRAVVISGDTRFSENLIKNAAGVNLIVHEVAMANQAYYEQTPAVRYIMAHHISPGEAGELFRRTQPKLAAFTHLVFLGAPGFPAPTPDDLVPKVREKYDGPLAVGVDLMSFDIRGDEVRVGQPPAKQ